MCSGTCGGCIRHKKEDTSREYRVGGVEGYRRIGRASGRKREREREAEVEEEVDEGVDEAEEEEEAEEVER